MNRRIDPIFDEGLAGFPGIAGAMRLSFLLPGAADSLRRPEDPG